MGLFGSILKAVAKPLGTVLGGPLGGVLGGGISALLGGHDNKGAIGNANAAEQAAIQRAIAGNNAQFTTTSANFNPWITNGQGAVNQEGDILGLNGDTAQSGALAGIKSSPLFQSIFGTGRDSVLASASATGGIRGGNVNTALAENGENAFATTVQQLLAQLGGISGQGLSAAGTVGALGAQNANTNASLLTDAGKANAGSILGRQAVDNNTQSTLGALANGAGVQDQIKALLSKFGIGGGSGGGGTTVVAGGGQNSGQDGGIFGNGAF